MGKGYFRITTQMLEKILGEYCPGEIVGVQFDMRRGIVEFLLYGEDLPRHTEAESIEELIYGTV